MKDMNKIFLMGRLGNSPIRRETKNGTPVTSFSMATSRRVKSVEASAAADGTSIPLETWEDETQWHQVVVWGKQGENCAQYLKKGSSVFVEGRIQSRRYHPKESSAAGTPIEKIYFEVHAENVSFLNLPPLEMAS